MKERRFEMAGSIYKVFLLKSTEAWYQLSEEEQTSLLAKVNEALEKVGGKTVVLCNSSWSSEQFQFFGVEEFPNIEAIQKQSALHNELNWLRYIESVSVLGTEWPLS
jgi:hypothetical protein